MGSRRLVVALIAVGAWLLACAPASGGAGTAPAPAKPAPSGGGAPAATPAGPASLVPAVTTLRIAAVNPLALYWPLYVASDQGLLQAQGIDLEIDYTSSPTRSAQVLVSGDVELGTIGADTAVESIVKGADLRIVAGGARNPNFRLATQPAVRDYADLRGKTLAVISPNLADGVFMKKLLEAHGLTPADYDLISIGGTAERYAALKSGAIAGTLLTQPIDFQAQDDGMNILGASQEVVPEYQFVTTTVRRDWAEQHRDLLVRYLKAIRAADQWLYQPANADRAVAVLVEQTQTREDYARRTYDLYYRQLKSMPEGAEVSRAGMTALLQIMAEQGRLDPPLPPIERFVDESYWRAAAGQ